MKRSFRLVFLFSILIFHNLSFAQVDTDRIKNSLEKIVNTSSYRHFMNVQTLDSIASYIYNQFSLAADTVFYQDYRVNDTRYRNVVAVFGSDIKETIVIGAHYDVCGQQDGADDNASGVAGLLELSVLLKDLKLDKRIELVAYTLEEPPYFRTENMGSYIHAKSLYDAKRDVYGMISLEMIGYFKQERKTQDYPIGLMKLFYGSRGNYIALVNKMGKGKFSRSFTKKFKKESTVNAKSITAPKVIPGIDFSDHLNYWSFGYSALMLTDTAFYRNKNYHMPTDTLETLDIQSMAKVIESVFNTLIK